MQNSLLKQRLQGAPEGRKIIDPYAKKIINVPFKAWDEYLTDYKKNHELYDSTVCSNILHAHMVKHLKNICLRESGLVYSNPSSKLHLIYVENRACVRFKKMDDDHRTSNIPTLIQKDLTDRQLDCLPGNNISHLINVGYVPNETWTGFKRLVITERYSDSEPIWQIVFDQSLKTIDDSYGTIDLYASTTANNEPEIEVKLKKK